MSRCRSDNNSDATAATRMAMMPLPIKVSADKTTSMEASAVMCGLEKDKVTAAARSASESSQKLQ